MEKVVLNMAMSLDGFVARPNDEDAGLHDWFFPPAGGMNAIDAGVVEESIRSTGATLLGHRTYDQGDRVDGLRAHPTGCRTSSSPTACRRRSRREL